MLFGMYFVFYWLGIGLFFLISLMVTSPGLDLSYIIASTNEATLKNMDKLIIGMHCELQYNP